MFEKKIFFLEFDPEPCPKWKCLSDLLLKEIPEEIKKTEGASLNNTKILVLCQDNRTCSQLNHYLTMGPYRYLFYMAFRRDLTINAVSSKYTKLKNPEPKEEVKTQKGKKPEVKDSDNKDEDIIEDGTKSNYLLTLSQSVIHSKEPVSHDESMFEPISQVIHI